MNTFTRKLLNQHLMTVFRLQNILCEFSTLTHKLKQIFCTQFKTILKFSDKQIMKTQIWNDVFNKYGFMAKPFLHATQIFNLE